MLSASKETVFYEVVEEARAVLMGLLALTQQISTPDLHIDESGRAKKVEYERGSKRIILPRVMRANDAGLELRLGEEVTRYLHDSCRPEVFTGLAEVIDAFKSDKSIENAVNVFISINYVEAVSYYGGLCFATSLRRPGIDRRLDTKRRVIDKSLRQIRSASRVEDLPENVEDGLLNLPGYRLAIKLHRESGCQRFRELFYLPVERFHDYHEAQLGWSIRELVEGMPS